jgi:hypothetical protein
MFGDATYSKMPGSTWRDGPPEAPQHNRPVPQAASSRIRQAQISAKLPHSASQLIQAPPSRRHAHLQSLLAEKERQLAAVGEMGQELIRQQQEMRDAIVAMERTHALEKENVDHGEDEEDAWVESGLRALQTNLKEYSQNNQTLLAKIQKAVSQTVVRNALC